MRLRPRIGIIGSGFGAIGVAVELQRHGYDDVRLWERADDLGGVWRDNTYPGAGCDVPSPLYCFSWAPSTRWTRRYGVREEIIAYLHEVATTYGVAPLVRFGHEVVAASWDDTARAWTVRFAHGASETVDVLVPAVGQLSRPALPPIAGIGDFDGPSFHSARWDHDADLTGRVAVIGTGASAVQFLPHLVSRARAVSVFQRTPNYVLPKPDGPFAAWYRSMSGVERAPTWALTEVFSRGLDAGSLVGRANSMVALGLLRAQVRDPELRRTLTPGYPIGCKRILFSNDYYPALTRPHVEVVSDPIERITPGGVVHGGHEQEFDAIVHGTGFAAQDFLDSIEVRGVGGRLLSQQWVGGARAYVGVHVPHFPNLFLSYGPNTNLGGGSIIYMLETQARHMRQVLDHSREVGARSVEVTEPAAQRWDTALQHRLGRSAWAHCESWYRDPSSGRITSNWPGTTHAYAVATAHLDADAFAWG